MWVGRGFSWPDAALGKPLSSPFVEACDDPIASAGPVVSRSMAHAAGVAELPRHLHHGDDHLPLCFHAGLIIFPAGGRIR